MIESIYRTGEIFTPVKDIIIVEPGVFLPPDCPLPEIRDAFRKAKIAGNQPDLLLFARAVFRIGFSRTKFGIYSPETRQIKLAVNTITSLTHELLQIVPEMIGKGYDPASPGQQLWTVAFEEAHHAASHATHGEIVDYISPDTDYERYLNQPIEKEVEEAFNGYVLRDKFGPEFTYYKKALFRKQKSKSYFYPRDGKDIYELSKDKIQFRVRNLLTNYEFKKIDYFNNPEFNEITKINPDKLTALENWDFKKIKNI